MQPILYFHLFRSPHQSLRLCLPIQYIIMLIQCRGCGRSFAPRGLSQHLSKTHDPRCRSALKAAASPSIQVTKTPPPLNPNGAEPISKDRECSGASGHGYNSEDIEGAIPQQVLHLAGYQPYPQLKRISVIWTTFLLNNPTLPISPMLTR